MTEINKIVCPDCKSGIKTTEGLSVGDIFECDQCGTEVEILSINPIEYKELVEEK